MEDRLREVDWGTGIRVIAGVLSVSCLFFPTGVVTDRLELNFHGDHVTKQRLHLFDDASFELYARSPNWSVTMNLLSGLIAAGCLTNVYLLTAPCMHVAEHAREPAHDAKPKYVYPVYVFAVISMVCTSVIALCIGLLVHSLHIDGGENAVDTRITTGGMFGLVGAMLTPLPNLALGLRFKCSDAGDELPQQFRMEETVAPMQWNRAKNVSEGKEPMVWDRTAQMESFL